jgi:hypothetical protein
VNIRFIICLLSFLVVSVGLLFVSEAIDHWLITTTFRENYRFVRSRIADPVERIGFDLQPNLGGFARFDRREGGISAITARSAFAFRSD